MRQFHDTGGSDQLRPLKVKIINAIYIIFGILAIPLAGASISRAFLTGWTWIYTYYIIIACAPVLVLFFLQRISYEIKVYLALLILFSEVILGTGSFGVLGNGRLFAILIIILAGLLLGKRQGYYAFIFSMLIIVIIAWLFIRHNLQYNFDVEQYVSNISVWISSILFIAGISLGLLEIFTRLMKAQLESSKKVTESEKRFHTIIQQAADAVYLSDMQGRIVEVNQQSCQQTGYSREELLQITIMELDSSYPTLDSLKELWNGILPGQSVKIEGSHVRKDGSEFPVEVSISTIELDNGKHTLGFARDISERRKAEEELRASEEKFRSVIEASPVGMAIFDPEQNVQKYNDKFTQLFGYTIEDIPNVNKWFPLAYPDEKYRAEVKQKWDTEIEEYLRTNEKFKPIEARVKCKDKSFRDIEFGFEAIGDTYITTFVDLTERKKAEHQLIENEKKLKEQNEEYLAINEELSESYEKITEINQELEAAIEKAEESEERFRNLSNLTFEGIFLHKDGICLDGNLSLEKMTGYKREELIGKNLIELLIPPEYREMAESHMKEEYTKPYELISRRKDGSVFDVEIEARSIMWKGNKIRVAATRDITDRKKAEMALQESEEKYRLLFEKANDAIFIMDGDVFIDCNPETLVMFGCKYDEIAGKTPADLSPEFQPDGTLSKTKALEMVKASLSGEFKRFEWMHTKKNGETFDAEVSLNRFVLKNKDYNQAITRDISARKKAEKALQASNEKYKRLANATFEGIGYTYKGQILETNSRIAEMYGYSEDEFKKLELKNLVHPEDLGLVMEHVKKNDETPYEHRAIRKDGSIFYIEARGKPAELDNKTVRLTILRDITERKNYEMSLAASELKFRNIFNSSSDGIMVSDFNKRILAVNQLILNYLRMDEEQVLSKTVDEFITSQFMPEIQKRMKMLEKGIISPAIEIEINLGKNLTLPVEINSKVIDFENQKAILTILRDISERKQMQHKIMQTIIQTEEKERNHFAKELHDGLGPLLSTMNIYMGILKDSKEEERRETAIERIQTSVEEAILSIRQISNSLSPHVLQNFGLPEAINNFCSRLKDIKDIKIRFKSNLEKRLNKDLELSLFRVIVELINNSIKYSGASLLKINIHLEKRTLAVDYADNGKGFKVEETLKSTRSMGLHNIYNRINSLNGKVDLTSQPGKGMNARIKFKIK